MIFFTYTHPQNSSYILQKVTFTLNIKHYKTPCKSPLLLSNLFSNLVFLIE